MLNLFERLVKPGPDLQLNHQRLRDRRATVLAQAMLREGMKSVAAGMNPMDLKRGIDKAVGAAVEKLAGISKPCSDHKERLLRSARFLQTQTSL